MRRFIHAGAAALLVVSAPAPAMAEDVLARDQISSCRSDNAETRTTCELLIGVLFILMPEADCMPELDANDPARTRELVVEPLLAWWEAYPEYLDQEILSSMPIAAADLWPCS